MDEVLGVIFRFKHELEFRPTGEYLNELRVILSDEMIDHKIPIRTILMPVGKTNNIDFRVNFLHTRHLTILLDYNVFVKDDNVKRFRYYTDPYNILTKFAIKFRKPKPICIHELLNLSKK